MTAAKPLARYGAVEGALASGFATAELHHVWGHDPIADNPSIFIALKSKLEPSRIAWIVHRVDSRNAHPSSSVKVSQL
ncbi:hypothetical protein NKH48_26255 [Mesorhizobium sp. M1233]|uniref:hypothetical protein n=1 Tax=Mesorhizobium sp. M1233 TaxID=2957072 RepID=UPI00333BB9A9